MEPGENRPNRSAPAPWEDISLELHKQVLSTRELAEAVGVSESSIKRWADDGTVRAIRTVGGHRRIPFEEVIRFVRAANLRVVRPEILGLADLERLGNALPAADQEGQALFHFLRGGEAQKARGLVLSWYLEGRSVAQIVDGPLKAAMDRLGEEWKHSPAGIFFEHRATDIALSSLHQLRALLPPVPGGGPVAVGGAPSGDPYMLPTLAVAVVLRSLAVDATNLGANTPAPALDEAVVALGARLLWLSVSSSEDPEPLRVEVLAALAVAERVQGTLLVGGRQAHRLSLASHPRLVVASSMAEVEAFVRGLSLSVSLV
ncbi:MAG TPA: helix-turn-helix domain-containing protein [Thermoanaerobaculia bacterium]|nr:helix-turn-helix domain-containing protein [Thermoanaerobaculia bacterium]